MIMSTSIITTLILITLIKNTFPKNSRKGKIRWGHKVHELTQWQSTCGAVYGCRDISENNTPANTTISGSMGLNNNMLNVSQTWYDMYVFLVVKVCKFSIILNCIYILI